MRIYQYYLPIFFWCEAQMAQYRRQESALVIGIQAPQGCGKTTLVEELKKLFEYTGRKAVAISVDDFYLTYRRQVELAKVRIPRPKDPDEKAASDQNAVWHILHFCSKQQCT